MPTTSLTGSGLQKYQRWLAVQRAKGIEPSQSSIQGFLQGEMQANVSNETNMQSLALKERALESDNDFRQQRLDYMDKQYDRQKGADKMAGYSELIKMGGGINQLTGGAITEGVQALGGGLMDLAGQGVDYLSGVGQFGDAAQGIADADMFSGVVEADFQGILEDAFDFTGWSWV